MPFFPAGSSTEAMPINKLACTEGFEDGDAIQTSFLNEGMVDFVQYDYDSFEGGWCFEGSLVEDDVTLALGQGAWFISSSAKHLTTSGQVKGDYKVRTLTESQQVISSLYPVSFCPNGENVSWNVPEEGAQIQTSFLNGDMIDFVSYDYDSFEGGWCLEGTLLEADEAIASPGEGFWLILGDEFADYDFTEVSPLYTPAE